VTGKDVATLEIGPPRGQLSRPGEPGLAPARSKRAPCAFRQSDAKRLVKAVVDAGVPVARVELGADGKITVIAGEPSGPNGGQAVNEWDQQEGGREK
jgi:hypothetical protein